MPDELARPLLGKIVIRGVVRALTGLHVGGSKGVIEIGGLDNPVIKDPVTQEPYIPGSSLKGKLRSLLERKVAEEEQPNNPAEFFNRDIGRRGYSIKIHAHGEKTAAAGCSVCRLFGSSADSQHRGSNFPARLRVRDALLAPHTRAKLDNAETHLPFTEIKYENALDRITAAANPRPLERVPPRSDFAFEIVYDVENPEEVKEDLENLLLTMGLLEDDALGGSGSRGSGKIKFYFCGFTALKSDYYKHLNADSNLQKELLQETAQEGESLFSQRAVSEWEAWEQKVEGWPTLPTIQEKKVIPDAAGFFQA